MRERLFGIETEYAISSYLNESDLNQGLLQLAREQLDHLPDAGGGLFLGNGSRFYIDCGHPELATPECTGPSEVVRYVLAGERILSRLVGEFLAADRFVGEVSLWKSNVDYSGTWATWGCHESYLHRMNPADLAAQIIPHLVSRIIYTGAGGFDSHSPGVRFLLSPRVPHLTGVMSANSTSERGIVHTKDEPLASEGFHRLHLTCGESLCSETAMWLKVATTALVVAMAEAGLRLNNEMTLINPLAAMRSFSGDPECKVTAEIFCRPPMTASEIQRHYLNRAEAHMHDSFMPPWAEEACRKWREILDRLERGPTTVNQTLDWAIKLALYEDFARRQGVTWKSLARWTRIREQTQSDAAALEVVDEETGSFEYDAPRPRSTFWSRRPFAEDMNESEFNKHLRVWKQLLEIDTRFSQFVGGGIFTELDRQGILDHAIPDIGDIEDAVSHPPKGSRARLRGDFIRSASVLGNRNRYSCDWQAIWDLNGNRALDLSDPFASGEKWIERHQLPPTADAFERACYYEA